MAAHTDMRITRMDEQMKKVRGAKSNKFHDDLGDRASLMPELPLTEHDTWVRANDTDDTVHGTWAASDSFERAGEKYVERKDERVSKLSFRQPILKLYDQLGGFIKRSPGD